MKKKVLLLSLLIIAIVSIFALSVSADTILPSDSSEYGALTEFDTPIGRTDISPNKADGTVARTVLYDGTNYYTIPTTYLLSKNQYESGGILLQFDFSAINNSALIGNSFEKTSIIRCELPAAVTLMAGVSGSLYQNFSGFTNMVDVTLSEGLSFAGNTTYKAFANCKSLTTIDASMMNFNYPNCTYSLFEYCEKLERIILPDAYIKDNSAINYNINYMFNGCKKLVTIENLESLFVNTTTIAEKAFLNCNSLSNVWIWDGVTTIGSQAFRGTAITSIVVPDEVSSLPDYVFADCTKLKSVVLSSNITSIGNYCFEKDTAIEQVWMPDQTTLTLGTWSFGKCGGSRAVRFYFPSASCTVTYTSTVQDDPFLNAYLGNSTSATIVYSEPLSTKCTDFLGGHEKPSEINDCTSGGACVVCSTVLDGVASEHSIKVSITYANGFDSVGVKITACQNWDRCTVNNKTEDAPVIFTAKGYSYKEDGTAGGISGGFIVDNDALNEYKNANPDKTVNISVLIVNPKYLVTDGTGSFFDADGNITATGGVVHIDVTNMEYSSFDYMVSGFSLDLMQSMELAFALVVYEDVEDIQIIQKQYAQDEASSVKSTYEDKMGLLLDAVTVQSIAPDVVAALKEQENS